MSNINVNFNCSSDIHINSVIISILDSRINQVEALTLPNDKNHYDIIRSISHINCFSRKLSSFLDYLINCNFIANSNLNDLNEKIRISNLNDEKFKNICNILNTNENGIEKKIKKLQKRNNKYSKIKKLINSNDKNLYDSVKKLIKDNNNINGVNKHKDMIIKKQRNSSPLSDCKIKYQNINLLNNKKQKSPVSNMKNKNVNSDLNDININENSKVKQNNFLPSFEDSNANDNEKRIIRSQNVCILSDKDMSSDNEKDFYNQFSQIENELIKLKGEFKKKLQGR